MPIGLTIDGGLVDLSIKGAAKLKEAGETDGCRGDAFISWQSSLAFLIDGFGQRLVSVNLF